MNWPFKGSFCSSAPKPEPSVSTDNLNDAKGQWKELRVSPIPLQQEVSSIGAYVVCWSLIVNAQSSQSVQVRVGYQRRSGLWFFRDLLPLYTYANFPIHFNVMRVLTVFGQSQSSVLTIGCEWISWIHLWQCLPPPKSKQTGRRGSRLCADAPRWRRCPRYCFG